MRAAASMYYSIFSQSFVRRVPPSKEGIWVAFDRVSPIVNVTDFGIGKLEKEHLLTLIKLSMREHLTSHLTTLLGPWHSDM